MKKKYTIFLLVFFITLGYAAVTTTLDIIEKTNIAYNEEDFRVEITSIKINNNDNINLIAKDKQSFTFIGSGNDILNYTVTNYSYQYDVKINLICNPSEGIEIEQIGELKGQSKESKTITSTSNSEVTCTINIEKISRTDYASEMCKIEEGSEWAFNYTGSEQEFIVPCDGEYKIELWGAQGGASNSTYIGGYGGYSKGTANLTKTAKIYINVGGAGQTNNVPYSSKGAQGGYNGGGTANPHSGVNHLYGAGGGATHVAFLSGQLYELENYKDKILIVSGGGGGGRWQTNYTEGHYGYGGHGGGFIGGNGTDNHGNYGSGGTQTGKTFGKGANNLAQAAGGGGFFGGTAGCSGGGGSGYIGNPLLKEKEMYCYKCQVSNEEATKTISTTCISSSPISNCAKQGHGYAKITYLGNNN